MQAARAKSRSPGAILLPIILLALSCAPASDDAPGATATAATADDVLRTADPYARGYTDSDFPRVQELAPGVYSYEQLRAAGEVQMLQHVRRFDGERGTRLSWLHHGIAHEEYHRAQLALYARLLGRTPALTRAIESADAG